jgi:superfamily II DNA or RNA helicase
MELKDRSSEPSSPGSTPDNAAEAHQGPIPGLSLSGGFSFRRGQHLFLSRLADAFRTGEMNHLGVFVPGYGKTITALASFVVAHHLGIADKLVVFVPRGNLRDQYADPKDLATVLKNVGAPSFSFCVADSEKVFLKNLGTQIIITTYQYASGDRGHEALLRYCSSGRCMFVFDEVHHLSEEGLWAQKIEQFPHVASIALSGTPMRSDNKTLFGVPFETGADGDQFYVALHEVTMRDAHEEGEILKRVEAHVVDYRIKMIRSDTGEEVEMSLSMMAEMAKNAREVDAYLARRKLRFHEVYLESLLGPAFERFAEKRVKLRQALTKSGRAAQGPFRNHQMLVIAMSNRHAAAILEFVRARFPQFIAARIGQDLPAGECRAQLEAYREGRIDVMVQVDMIGEGTDIKPISVIVKADLVRAYSKTLQQVFRGMRYFDGFPEASNVCDIYAANDSGVVHVLEWITSEEQIGVRLRQKRANGHAPPGGADREPSAWELKDVSTQRMRSHSLDLFPGYGAGASTLMLRETSAPDQRPQVVDMNEVEKTLRKECAELAGELYHVLQAEGQAVEIRDIHGRAKRHLHKGQGDLSIQELERKKKWLERCLRSRRLV